MAENGGRHDHLSVIAAFEDLEVRAAGQRRLDADPDFAGVQWRRLDVFNPDELFPEEDGGFHARSLSPPAEKTEANF